jgi:Ca2+-binding EF-hand superfamily protein
VDLECIAEEDFASARKLARTRGMFRTVDKDNSDTIDRSELWRAIRKYRVPITREDLETIMRVLDPDQCVALHLY